MLSVPATAKRCPWRILVMVLVSIISVCAAAHGQIPESGYSCDEKEVGHEICATFERFVENTFTKCGDSGYLGLITLPELACTFSDVFREGGRRREIKQCQGLLGFKDLRLWPVLVSISPADQENRIKLRFVVRGDYSTSRSRHILDGNWEEWGPSENKQNNTRGELGPYDFEYLWRKNGEWSGGGRDRCL